MTRDELESLPLVMLGVTGTIFPDAKPLPEFVPGAAVDYFGILCALLNLNPATASTGTIDDAIHRWYETHTGKKLWDDSVKSLSASGSVMEDEAVAEKIRKAMGISQELWDKYPV